MQHERILEWLIWATTRLFDKTDTGNVKQVQSLFSEPGTWSKERTKDRVMCYENKTFYNTFSFPLTVLVQLELQLLLLLRVENSVVPAFNKLCCKDTKVKLCVLPLVQRLPPTLPTQGWMITWPREERHSWSRWTHHLELSPQKIQAGLKLKKVSPRLEQKFLPPTAIRKTNGRSTKNKSTVFQS